MTRRQIDIARLRANAQRIRQRAGVEVWAVIKADAYGLGARRIASAIADLVDGFCVFQLREAIDADLWRTAGKPAIALGPPDSLNPCDYLAHRVRPAVSTVEQARALRTADPILCIDTGMARFACPEEHFDAIIEAGACREAFTHATRLEHVQRLQSITAGKQLKLHAAASSLLDVPAAWLDAVRPGLALYDQAVTVHTPLVEVHRSRGPAGYTGFTSDFHGVILAGYAHGLRPGPCLIRGRSRRILEVGMQSAYVEASDEDRAGDEVILLGPDLSPQALAPFWHTTPHEVLLTLARHATRDE